MKYCPGCESVDYRINPVHTLIKRSFFIQSERTLDTKCLTRLNVENCQSVIALWRVKQFFVSATYVLLVLYLTSRLITRRC